MSDTLNAIKRPALYQTILSWGIIVFCATVTFSIAASQAAIITALVAWLLAAIAGRRWEWKKNVMTIPVVIFLATQLLSVILSIDVMRSVKEFKSYWHILVFFLVVNRCDEKTARRGIAALLAAAGISALVGIGQSLYTVVVRHGLLIDHRITGTMGMHMTYSGVVMMATLVALSLSLSGGVRRNMRLLAAGTLALTSCALALSLTRSAWLGLAAGAVAIALVKERRLILVMVAALIIGYFVAPREIRDRA
ncbi:MAG TPA: hypothetical protein P5287_04715, partial [bacterium]|nr:hypothetical protein [bacterium]